MGKSISFLISFFLVFSFCTVQNCLADSLFGKSSHSPYSSQKNYKIGDIITVLVLETTSAVQKAGTDTQNQDNLSASLTHTINRISGVIAPNSSATAGWGNKYNGAGSTTRSSNVIASVPARITGIDQGGNLSITGRHKVSVNEEIQDIVIKGAVRAMDITSWNTVYSYQVADADISVKGVGSVGSASQPGIITRFFDMIF
ncbi:MAG: flagellar basal body L-ring protein FlgH [Candidatus Margulisiibacteriota bacterium]